MIKGLISSQGGTLAHLSYLPFDSQLFGIPMGKIDDFKRGTGNNVKVLKELLASARVAGFQHIHFRVRADQAALVEATQIAGMRLVCSSITFKKSLAQQTTKKDAHNIRPANMADFPDLLPMTRDAFREGTRFVLDSNLPSNRAIELHETWLLNSLRGRASMIAVAQKDDAPIGYITIEPPGSIGLLAVDKQCRRLGVGMSLLDYSFAWCRDEKIDELAVTTECFNYPAINLYLKAGFSIIETTYSFSWKPR